MSIEDIDVFWVLLCACLVWIMQAGFLGLETGLTRSKNNINVALKNICDNATSIFLFWVVGFSIAFGNPFSNPLSVEQNYYFFNSGDNRVNAFFVFQAVFCSTCCTIVSGAAAERLRFIMYPVLVAFIAGLIYPVAVNAGWGGTIIKNDLGVLVEQGFYDFAGATLVHSTGGWIALALIIVVGPRLGRFNKQGEPQIIQGSNLTLSSLGVLILWFGWLGFNGGSAYNFDSDIGIILSNTLIAGSASLVFTLILVSRKGQSPAAEDLINGALGGLVGITGGANCISALYACLVGFGSAAAVLVASRLLLKYKLDDVVGAVPVHLAAGIWGSLAVGLFGDLEQIGMGLSRLEQIQAQLIGVAGVGIWAFGGSFLIIKSINYFLPFRVSKNDEIIGLNISEHSASTDLYELIAFMKYQSDTGSLDGEAPAGMFTESGVIGMAYNHVLGRLRENQEKLIALNKELESANDELSAYDHIVAHDLKNPIAIIRSYASMIEEDGLEASESLEYVRKIRRSTEDALRIIKELLNFAKAKNGDASVEEIALADLVEKALAQVEQPDSEIKPQLSLDLQQATVRFNEFSLNQILTNLISNAVKYSPKAPAPTVIVRSRREAESDIIEVEDKGIGMSESQVAKAFDKHSRLHTDVSEASGDGLGLYNVKKLVEANGAAITVHSVEGQGTCFTLRLPIVPVPVGSDLVGVPQPVSMELARNG